MRCSCSCWKFKKESVVETAGETSVSCGNENGRPRLLARGADRNRRNCRSSGGAAIKTDRKREGGGEKGETIEGEGVREGTVFPVGNVADNFNVKQPEPAYGKACINHVTRHRRSSLRCGHSFNSITIYKIMIYRTRLIKTA